MGGRRWWVINLAASLVMAAILAGLAFGLPAVDGALPAERPVRSDRPYPVGAGIIVVPPAGAYVDVTRTRPGDTTGTVLFLLGPVRYAIVVQPFEGDLTAAAGQLRRRITATTGYQVTGAEVSAATDAGLAGIQGGYTAPGRGGRYAVFVDHGLAIEVTVSGDDLGLDRTLAAVDTSTRTIRYEGSK